MTNRPTDQPSGGDSATRADQLDRVSAHLEAILESVDLESEPHLAEAVIDAIRATERASDIDASAVAVAGKRASGHIPASFLKRSEQRRTFAAHGVQRRRQ
ncbi:hypothetical protein [Halovenus marina]|uniref:hypothetical protein n=1 Tax=Halovenus marina TaxID=3396621 RepID=UPI003F56AABF